MKIVAALIKADQVIDTCIIEMPTRDDLAEAAKKAFAYFCDRHSHLTAKAEDVLIAFREDDRESGDRHRDT